MVSGQRITRKPLRNMQFSVGNKCKRTDEQMDTLMIKLKQERI